MCDTKESIIHARTSVIMGFWVEMDGLERTRFEKIGEKKSKMVFGHKEREGIFFKHESIFLSRLKRDSKIGLI